MHMVAGLRRLDRTDATAAALAATVVAWGAARAGDGHFWLDEAYTAALAHQPLGDLAESLRHEGGMGPYYLVLWAWSHLGTSEWWLRLVSAAGGAATVATVFAFTARRVGGRAAALAVALLVCNPVFLYHLTELRAYTWTMFAAVAATWTFLRLREQPTVRRAVAYGTTLGLSLGLLAFSLGLVVAHALCAIGTVRQPAHRRAFAVAGAVAAGLLAPWVWPLFTSDQLDWIAPTTPRIIVTTLTDALGGTVRALAYAAGMLALAASLLARRHDRHRDAGMVVLTGCLALPIALVVVSLLQPVLLARYLAPMLPLAAIAAAVGAIRTIDAVVPAVRLRVAATVVALAVCAWSMPGSLLTAPPRPEDLYGPAAQLTREVRAGDAVTFGEPLEALAIGWYFTAPPGVDPGTEACRTWVVSRDVNVLMAATNAAPGGATIAPTGYLGWGVVLIDVCG